MVWAASRTGLMTRSVTLDRPIHTPNSSAMIMVKTEARMVEASVTMAAFHTPSTTISSNEISTYRAGRHFPATKAKTAPAPTTAQNGLPVSSDSSGDPVPDVDGEE